MNGKCQAVWYIQQQKQNISSVGKLIVAGKRVNMKKEQKGDRMNLFSEERTEINYYSRVCGHADTDVAL